MRTPGADPFSPGGESNEGPAPVIPTASPIIIPRLERPQGERTNAPIREEA